MLDMCTKSICHCQDLSRSKPRRQISLLAAQTVHRSSACPNLKMAIALVPAHSLTFSCIFAICSLYFTPTASSISFCASSSRTMACDSACCAPPKALPAIVRTTNPTLPNIDISDSVVTCDQDTSSQSQPNDMANDCHDRSAKCTPKKNGCHSSKSVDVEAYDLKRPSCCEGKLSPCCDSSCIDRLALRDCATESESPSSRALQSATDPCIL